MYNLLCLKFRLISWCGNFVERHSFRIVSDKSTETMRNSAFSQIFCTRKIAEITVFNTVLVGNIENYCYHSSKDLTSPYNDY